MCTFQYHFVIYVFRNKDTQIYKYIVTFWVFFGLFSNITFMILVDSAVAQNLRYLLEFYHGDDIHYWYFIVAMTEI